MEARGCIMNWKTTFIKRIINGLGQDKTCLKGSFKIDGNEPVKEGFDAKRESNFSWINHGYKLYWNRALRRDIPPGLLNN